MKERVNKDLKKLRLFDKVSDKIYFLSTKKISNKYDTIDKLRSDIWAFLLKENKFGLIRLSQINKEINRSLRTFNDVLNTRLLDDKKRKKLEGAIEDVKDKVPELSDKFNSEKENIKRQLFQSLNNRKLNTWYRLQVALERVGKDKPLPKNIALKRFLTQSINETLENTNQEYANYINILKDNIDDWIEINLKQIREIISGNGEKRIVDFSEIENYKIPEIDLSSSLGMGALGLIVGFIINPPAAIFAGFIGFFGNLIMSSESRRAKQIAKIVSEARKRYDIVYLKLENTYSEIIDENSDYIKKYINEQLTFFFDDLTEQTKKLNEEISISDLKLYESAFIDIDEIRSQVKLHEMKLQQYYTVL